MFHPVRWLKGILSKIFGRRTKDAETTVTESGGATTLVRQTVVESAPPPQVAKERFFVPKIVPVLGMPVDSFSARKKVVRVNRRNERYSSWGKKPHNKKRTKKAA